MSQELWPSGGDSVRIVVTEIVNYGSSESYWEVQGTLRVANGGRAHLGSWDSVVPSCAISTVSEPVQKVLPRALWQPGETPRGRAVAASPLSL